MPTPTIPPRRDVTVFAAVFTLMLIAFAAVIALALTVENVLAAAVRAATSHPQTTLLVFLVATVVVLCADVALEVVRIFRPFAEAAASRSSSAPVEASASDTDRPA